MNRFEGKTAIITGAGSGLGRACAVRFASEGAAVACMDIDAKAVEKTAADIGGKSRAYTVDISDPDSVRGAVGGVIADLGGPEVLVNCAGIGKFANSHEMPFEDWSRIIGVNLTGTFLMCQAVLPSMLSSGGNIVNIASNAGLMGAPYSAAYCSSKGGVVQLTRALADEYLERKVRINAIAPGSIATPLQKAFHEMPEGADFEKLGKIISPLGDSQPEEIAALVAFVASKDGRFMTGSIVSIDGGLTI